MRWCTNIPAVGLAPGTGRGKFWRRRRWQRRPSVAYVPYLLASSDILYGLASGMTIKFFPVFFQDPRYVGLKPSSTNYVMAGQPLAIAVGSLIAQRLARSLGEHHTPFPCPLAALAWGVGLPLCFTSIASLGAYVVVTKCRPVSPT
jgi:hypothetical protein